MIKNRKIKISTLLISITAMSSLAFSLSSCGVIQNTNANTDTWENRSYESVNFNYFYLSNTNDNVEHTITSDSAQTKLESLYSVDGTGVDKTKDYVIYVGSQACPFCRLVMQGDITIAGQGDNEYFAWNPSLKKPNDGGDAELVQNTPLRGSITTLSTQWPSTKTDKYGKPVQFYAFEDKAEGYGFDDIPSVRGDDAALNFMNLYNYFKSKLSLDEYTYWNDPTKGNDQSMAARWHYHYTDKQGDALDGYWPQGIPIILFVHDGKIVWNDTTWADKTNGIIDYDNLTDKENCMYYNSGFEKVFNQYFGTQK